MYNRQTIGQQAENAACAYLTKQGLSLVTRNYRCYHGEIDLIMRDQDDIVFVEVRSRRRTDFGTALESINQAKIIKLTKAASHFLQAKKWHNKVSSRFDVIAIHPIAGHMQLEWIKNAFSVEI